MSITLGGSSPAVTFPDSTTQSTAGLTAINPVITSGSLTFANGSSQATSSQMTLIGTVAASNSATVQFAGLSGASYSQYYLVISGIVPTVNAVSFLLRISTGSGFLSANYRHGTWRWTNAGNGVGGSTSDSQWIISSAVEVCGTGANQSSSYTVFINDVGSTLNTKRATWSASGLWASNTYVYMQGGGEVDTQSNVIDGIQLLMSSGNISSGTISLYGIKNA